MKKKLKPYKSIAHTADLGINAFGKSKKELFENTALGMFAIIAEKKLNKQPKPVKTFTIDLHAKTEDELLVNWLSELLTLADINNCFFDKIKVTTLSATQIKAKATAFKLQPEAFKFKTQIKAATYHQLKIEIKNNRYFAQVFFDV